MGAFAWRWVYGGMALWLLVLMVSFGESTLTFSCIRQITQRSVSPCDFFSHFPDFEFHRVILSTIRNLGKCPSPRMLLQKQYILGLGTRADDQRQNIHLDDNHWKNNVELAQKFIFENGLGIKSTGVEGLLESKSYMPTQVQVFASIHTLNSLTNVILERLFPSVSPHSTSILFLVCPQSPAWVWTWGMESSVHPFNLNLICCWEQFYSNAKLAVHSWFLQYIMI